MPSIEERLASIETRNLRVEADKAWEKSLTRRAFLALITWLAAAFTLALMGSPEPGFLALVPVLGYIISTLSLTYLRRFWMEKVHARAPKK